MKISTVAFVFAVVFSLYLLQAKLFPAKQTSQITSQSSTAVEKPTTPTKASATSNTDSNNQPTAITTWAAQTAPMQIKQRPKWKLTGDITGQLKALQHQATRGDHQASYLLSMNYKYCINAADSEKALEEKLQQAQELADSTQATNNINIKYQYCQSITTQQRNAYYDHLLDAAKNAQVAAQEVIGTITPEQYMRLKGNQNLGRDQHIAKRSQFIEQKLQLLTNAAHHGSIKALMRLSNMQHSQNYGPNGYTKAYAYNQIILELTEDNDIYNRYSWFQQKMYEQLTPKEIEQAQEITATWLTKIRQNGTLYLSTHQ